MVKTGIGHGQNWARAMVSTNITARVRAYGWLGLWSSQS